MTLIAIKRIEMESQSAYSVVFVSLGVLDSTEAVRRPLENL